MEAHELNDMITFINGLLRDKYRYISMVCRRMSSRASTDDLELRKCFSAECNEYIKLNALLIRYMKEMIERSDSQIQQINAFLNRD